MRRPANREGAAAAIVERRAATTDEACGRSDPIGPPPSAAGPQDRARAAWIGNAAWPAAWVARPRRTPARVARAIQRGIRINRLKLLDSGSGKQETTARIGRIGNYFRHRQGSPGPKRSACRFTLCSRQGPQLGYPPGSFSRKGRWRQAGPISSRAKSARHAQSERRLVWGNQTFDGSSGRSLRFIRRRLPA
jgi:hypothetical protein